MSPVGVTCRRTLARARNLITTALSIAAFLAASAALFAFRLEAAEGTHQPISVLWAGAVAPFLPVLAALLGMDVWSDERQTGRLDLLFSVAVRERDFVLGKLFGVWILTMLALVASLVSTLGTLVALSPSATDGLHLVCFVPSFVILGLQSLLWCAVATAMSALCRQSFAAAALTTAVLVALPRGLWLGAMAWAPSGRPAWGEMPLDAQVTDFSSGVMSSSVFLIYLGSVAVAVFFAVKCLTLTRFAGRKSRMVRLSTLLAVLLSVACLVSVSMLVNRLDVSLDVPVGTTVTMSPRMRTVLSESSGRMTVTAFLSRKSPEFRPLAHYLRLVKRQADSLGGLEVELRFVDPRWDVGPADRLVRQGAQESSLVFEKGHRLVSVPLSEGFGDTVVASAIQRVALPPQRRDIYWTLGHGENGFADYGPWGMSDMARDLSRNGYRNLSLDLSREKAVSADCALLVVAGAKDAFSRVELDRLEAYLKTGGRLLVLMGPAEEAGVSAILPSWGVRPLAQPVESSQTLSGSDVLVSDFADHPVCAGLDGVRLVLEKPLTFEPSAAVSGRGGADRLDFTSLARISAQTVVAAVERGASIGQDLAVRPTRIVVIGDPLFALNGQLAVRANANREFFLNAIAYLSGSEAWGAADETAVLKSGMDRTVRRRFVVASAIGVPLVVFLVLMLGVIRRRRRG